MKQPIFALIDCNNFFVSCLRLFQPNLENQPVVALSSNDGCVVARSNEAKALGIPMGAPVFKWRQFFKNNHVVQVSGNFELYGDISKRIINLLATITPHLEIYSIDESFLDLSELKIEDYTIWGREVRKLIQQHIGIPVAVGIAPTKTLAKLASKHAKKNLQLDNVLNLENISKYNLEQYLKQTPVQDVWGIGRKLAIRLYAEGINSAKDLAAIRPQYAQSLMGINGRQTATELNGISCYPLQKCSKPAKSITSTRTFGEDTNQFYVIESALTALITNASQRLRTNNQLARQLGFFIATNRFRPGYINHTAKINLNRPTNDSGQLIKTILQLAYPKFSSKHQYHRAGIWLSDLVSQNNLQFNLFDKLNYKIHTDELSRMQAVDSLNKRYGKHTVYYAGEDLGNAWQPKHCLKTPHYTTSWSDLPKIKLV